MYIILKTSNDPQSSVQLGDERRQNRARFRSDNITTIISTIASAKRIFTIEVPIKVLSVKLSSKHKMRLCRLFAIVVFGLLLFDGLQTAEGRKKRNRTKKVQELPECGYTVNVIFEMLCCTDFAK